MPSGTLNGGSYRSDSPDLDSPRDSRDRSDRYQSSSYIQKIKDRGRNDYKKDKYLDKRDRRDRDAEHRTNHDRIEMSSSSRRSSKLSKYIRKRVRLMAVAVTQTISRKTTEKS